MLTFFQMFVFCLHELNNDSLGYRNHHRRCSCVTYPHGQETRDQHEAKHQPAMVKGDFLNWLVYSKTSLNIKSNKYEFFPCCFFMQIGLTGIKQSIFNLLELRSCKLNRDLKIFGNLKGVIAAHPTVVCWENGWTLHV